MTTLARFRSRRTVMRLVSVMVITGIVAGFFWPSTASLYAESRPAGAWRSPAFQEDTAMADPEATPQTINGLTVLLGEGAQQPSAPGEQLPVAPATPLTQAEIQAILDRLPPLPVEETDIEAFKLPPQSLPPPTAATVVTETFPPADAGPAAPAVPSGPLEVLRYAPEGEIPIAPFLNVTFNQPMVPLATLDELAAADVPVKITPELPGVWKWLGTQTLSFEYRSEESNRFPMATTFTVEVPAGTTSAVGGVLEKTITWSFQTPAPSVTTAYPGFGPQPRDPVMFVAFDQAIDAAAVLETITVMAGGERFALRMATDEEIAAVKDLGYYLKNTPAGRWLAFRAEKEFPPNTTVTVNIGPGTPSAEGPLTTTDVQSFSFQTYAALRVTNQNCTSGSPCQPAQPFWIEFNNPLDVAAILADLVTVEPAIPGMVVSASYSSLQIRGLTAGRTTYKVTLDAGIPDVFGQTLGEPVTLTFHTGSASSYLTGPRQPLLTLDPTASRPVFTIYSVNYDRVRVRVYSVTPDDWRAYMEYSQNYYRDPSGPPPGKEIINTTVEIDAQPDTLTETSIDLSPALGGKPGHLIVVVDKPPSLLSLFTPDYNYVVRAWVQATAIGLDAIVDNSQMVAWATSLRDGAPLAGVELALRESGQTAVTGADGTARIELNNAPANLLVAHQGDDVAFLPRNTYGWDDYGWMFNKQTDELRWYVFDDRAMYRPGEEVHVKGWIRHIGAGTTGDVDLQFISGAQIDYRIIDPQGNQLTNGTAEVNDLGGFDLAFSLPENTNLGYASIEFSARNIEAPVYTDYYHSFQIQEFRRPEFEVAARNETTGPYYLGDEAVVAVSAQYYAGGPLPNADTTWTVTAQPGFYSPPNWDDFVFGVWEPWWYSGGYYSRSFASDVVYYEGFGPYGPAGSQTFESRTDATGNHYLKMTFIASDEPRPYSVQAEARVMDVNRQTWAANTGLLVHPSKLYVGLRSAATFVEKGDPIELDVIVTDVEGKVVEGQAASVRAVRVIWVFEAGQWKEQEVDEQICELTSAAEPQACTFDTREGGQYRIAAEVRDDAERLNRTIMTIWVSGGPTVPSRDLQHQALTLIPDQDQYQPGDTARVLVQAPFTDGQGLLTVSREGILYTSSFSLDGGTATLEIPIEEEHIPNLNIQVDVNGSAPRLDDKGNPVEDAPPRPAYAVGSLNLPVPPLQRALSLTLTPEAERLEPGAETALDVTVVDADGAPVQNAELAIVVVDEAILALTNYRLADPLDTFYAIRGNYTSSYYSRDSLVLASPADLASEIPGVGGGAMVEEAAMAMEAPMATAEAGMAFERSADMVAMPAAAPAPAGAKAEAEAPAPPIGVRTNFNPLALFAPAERTDANGQVRVTYKLPDSLTRYRVMVVAATEQQFGMGEANVTARLPLMVRPSAPRFLNFGDSLELPVVIQNQTDEALTVEVVADTANLILAGVQGQRVEVPANDRVEVRFPATTDSVGTARVQFAAVTAAYADAATVDMAVYTPATTEAFAVYGTVDEGAMAQPIASPQDVFPQFGGLEVSTSSTALSTLTDAVLYLQSYPFECSEQLASRIMSVAALRDVLTAFQAAGLPSPTAMQEALARDIAALESMQNSDGGFPYWTRGYDSIPYNSVFVVHALQVARNKDYAVPQAMMDRALDYLRTIESHYPSWYSARTRHAISSYAVYVRQLMGDIDLAKARSLYDQYPVNEQSLEALAFLWQILSGDPTAASRVDEIERRLQNSAVETAGMANFITSYDDQEYVMLHSNRRTDAIVLDGLIKETPDSDLIAKVVRGLMAGRTKGRWGNTQENVFVLLAMDSYFNTFERTTPDFVARVWLGDTYVAEHEYQGRTTETRQTLVPMSVLVEQPGTQNLSLVKDGEGRLYYRLGLRYAPTDLGLDALDMGFVVQRTYEAVDDPTDVRRDEEGVWHIKAGARVRIRITMVAVNRRYHVALVDRLPAGLEIINPDLAVAESVPADPSAQPSYWWWRNWYEHQNLRDAGAEAFTPFLWDGVYNYSYVARATTPGEFVVPPAKAEEMYSPEVFGRSDSDKVIVE